MEADVNEVGNNSISHPSEICLDFGKEASSARLKRKDVNVSIALRSGTKRRACKGLVIQRNEGCSGEIEMRPEKAEFSFSDNSGRYKRKGPVCGRSAREITQKSW